MLGGPSEHSPRKSQRTITGICVPVIVRDPQDGNCRLSAQICKPEAEMRAAPSRTRRGSGIQEQQMRSALFSKIVLAVLTLGLATSAFAANKGNFQISGPVQVNGTEIPAGDYVAKWDGTGPDVKVDITRNGKVLATVPAKVVDLNSKAPEDAAEVNNKSNGSRELTGLRFSGKKIALEISNQTTQAENKTKDSAK